MKFCWKFYESIKFQVFSLGLLLSFSAISGVDYDCNYFQNLEPGKVYYAFNPRYPKFDYNRHCLWKMESPNNISIYCEVNFVNPNCLLGTLIVQLPQNSYQLCTKCAFFIKGMNYATIEFYLNRSKGKFLCTIESEIENDCNCGQKKLSRIVGGKETGINEYPMMCGLVDVSLSDEIYCGCTIISQQYVISAGHCLEKKDPRMIGVVVGEHDVTTGRETNATKLFRLDSYKIHPQYDSDRLFNDVAVCKIIGTIPYSTEVGPVCLPFQHKQNSFIGSKVTALGWGLLGFGDTKSNTLQKVDLNVISLEECKNNNRNNNVNSNNICTYTPGKDTCQMDSGGPLLWENPKTNKIVLAGIISAGIGCATNKPSISMRTGAYIDWIESVTPGVKYCRIE